MKTCQDCGERVYNLGCTNCNEGAYIEEQEYLTELQYRVASAEPDTDVDAVDPVAESQCSGLRATGCEDLSLSANTRSE